MSFRTSPCIEEIGKLPWIEETFMTTLCKIALVIAGSGAGLLAANLSWSDQTFAKKAAQGGMAEVQLGQLAVNKAGTQKVKDFGQKMVDDHSKANDQLKSIAAKNGINLPPDVAPPDKALMNRLSGLSGSAFDKAYMGAMVKDHETDIALFQHEANGGTNSDLKGFASNTLPTLQEHLTLAKDAAGSVGAMGTK
jgi:putative membrane protein